MIHEYKWSYNIFNTPTVYYEYQILTDFKIILTAIYSAKAFLRVTYNFKLSILFLKNFLHAQPTPLLEVKFN